MRKRSLWLRPRRNWTRAKNGWPGLVLNQSRLEAEEEEEMEHTPIAVECMFVAPIPDVLAPATPPLVQSQLLPFPQRPQLPRSTWMIWVSEHQRTPATEVLWKPGHVVRYSRPTRYRGVQCVQRESG